MRLERWGWAALAATIALALGLRLVHIGARSLWYDEAFSVFVSEPNVPDMVDAIVAEDESGVIADVHPLLYYVVLGQWKVAVGDDLVAVRVLSVLFGLATVLAVFGLVRDWFGTQTAFAAALITAIAPFHVQYSQEVRMYALMGLLLVLATWAYWRACERSGWGYWLAFSILAAASMYTQQLAAFHLLALALLPLLLRDFRLARLTVAAGLLAVLLYVPWLRYVPGQYDKLGDFWIQRPNILHFWLTLRSFISVNLDFSPSWWLPTFLMAAVLPVLVVWRGVVAIRTATLPDDATARAVLWTLWLAFVPMVLMWVTSQVLQPVYLIRALVPSALLFYIALGWLFTQANVPGPILVVLGGGWLIIVVFSLVTHYTWDEFPTPPFDDGAAYLVERVEPGDVVVHGNKITAFPMVFFEPEMPQRYVRDIEGSGSNDLAVSTQRRIGLAADACAAIAAQGAPRVWYVAFAQLADEMAALIKDDPVNQRYDSLAWFQAHYHQDQVTHFEDLDIYLFVEPDADAQQMTCDEVVPGA